MAGPLDLLLGSAAQLFADACTPELQERVEAGEWPRELWTAVEENGLPLLLVPEDADGIGLGWAEASALLRLAGAFAVPLPLAETMLANRLLARASIGPLPGPLSVTPLAPQNASPLARSLAPALPTEQPSDDSDRPLVASDSFTLSETEDGAVLAGRAARVPWLGDGSVVSTLLVMVSDVDDADQQAARRIAAVPARQLTLGNRRTAAGEPAADVVADGVELSSEQIGWLPAELPSSELSLGFALLRSAQIAGAMDRILDLTLEHARGRQQFGRAIAKFQAVQQQIAVLASDVAVVGAAVEAAARALDRGDGELAVAAARARSSEAVARVSAIAHQVHGAIGFTREHVLHRFTRRLWSWRDDGGNEREWQQRVGAAVVAAGADGVWPLLCREP